MSVDFNMNLCVLNNDLSIVVYFIIQVYIFTIKFALTHLWVSIIISKSIDHNMLWKHQVLLCNLCLTYNFYLEINRKEIRCRNIYLIIPCKWINYDFKILKWYMGTWNTVNIIFSSFCQYLHFSRQFSLLSQKYFVWISFSIIIYIDLNDGSQLSH